MNIPPKKRVQAFIRTVVEENNWTAAELAQKLEVKAPRVSEWLSGTHVPSAEILFKIADLVKKEVVLGDRPDFLD